MIEPVPSTIKANDTKKDNMNIGSAVNSKMRTWTAVLNMSDHGKKSRATDRYAHVSL